MRTPLRFVALVLVDFVPGNQASAQLSRLWNLHLPN